MIRGVKGKDSEKLHLLFKEKHKNIACKFIHPDIHETRIETFVYEENNEIEGMIVITAIKYSTNPYGTVEELIIKSSDEEHTIEKSLLNSALEWFKKNKINRVFIFAESEESEFFEKMGFEESDMVMYYKNLNE
ncbi:MAG: GNAT family N-acetyltransferase [Proteobacteria bacterium]|nr:GNAT family N-acetyltransferase [Pseudomonadota bacterium]